MAERRDVIKSKTAIKEAFLSVCWEKNARKITVKEIIDKANVSRGTFYAHYEDVFDLKEKIENEIIEQIFSDAQADDIRIIINEPASKVLGIITAFYENSNDIIRLIGKEKEYSFFFKCEQRLIEILSDSKNYFDDRLKRTVIDNCIASMIIKNCYKIICEESSREDAEKTAAIIGDFIYKAVH